MVDACSRTEPLQSAWLDGALEPRTAAELQAHLRGCARCRRDLQALRTARGLLRSLPVRQLPDRLRPWAQLAPLPTADPGAAAGPAPPTASGSAAGVPAAGAGAWGTGRLSATLAVLVVLLGGAVLALGADPADRAPTVQVPVEVFVADHVVRTAGGPMPGATLVERRP